MKNLINILFVTGPALLFVILTAEGANIYVATAETSPEYEDGTPENPYSSIQTAIDVAKKGDVIRIGKGNYQVTDYTFQSRSEAIKIENKTDLTLRPWNDPVEDEVVLEPTMNVFRRVPSQASNNIITIRNSNKIEIHDLSLISEYGYVHSHRNLVLIENSKNCFLSGLQMASPETGVSIKNSQNISVLNSDLNASRGIIVEGSMKCRLVNNNLYDSAFLGIKLTGSSNNLIKGNRLYNTWNAAAIDITGGSNRNKILNNKIDKITYGYGIHVYSSHNLIRNNDITKAMNVYSPPIFVGSPDNKIIRNTGAENLAETVISEGNIIKQNDNQGLNFNGATKWQDVLE